MQTLTSTPTEYLCRVLLLHLPNTSAEFCCYAYRMHMQSFAATPTEQICRTLLLHLPNAYVEFCCYTYLLGKTMDIIAFKRTQTVTT